MISTVPRTLAVLASAALVLSACSDDAGESADGKVEVVASTNVYGDIAHAIGGDLVDVTSLITSSSQDPHEYEASAQDRLALDGAALVIKNGGGYDPFIDTLLDSAGGDAVVLDAVEISGLAPAEGAGDHADEEGHDHIEGFNEHVWYDFHTVEKVAEAIGDELAKADPDNADTYEENTTAYVAKVQELETAAEDLKATADGRGVAITEPVPLYLLSEVGLVNHTPEEFSEAVEEGADVPARVLQETLDLFADEDIAVLAYNTQAADATTEKVREAAEAADVAVVDFTETLPDGKSYLEWQQDNIDQLAAALEK